MSAFIQCKDENDAETEMNRVKAAFVSSDFRVYENIEFWDDAGVMEIPASTLLALYQLQTDIENAVDGMNEMPFDDVVDRAKDLEASFKNACEAIKFKPLVRKTK